MTEYCLGFLFDSQPPDLRQETDPPLDRVVLIRKKRPDWQAGFLNGIGGQIIPGEKPASAMTREFKEEAGVEIPEWKALGALGGPDWICYLYCAKGPVDEAKTMTDEKVGVYNVYSLSVRAVVDSVLWLVPLARAALLNKGPRYAEIVYGKYGETESTDE